MIAALPVCRLPYNLGGLQLEASDWEMENWCDSKLNFEPKIRPKCVGEDGTDLA